MGMNSEEQQEGCVVVSGSGRGDGRACKARQGKGMRRVRIE